LILYDKTEKSREKQSNAVLVFVFDISSHRDVTGGYFETI